MKDLPQTICCPKCHGKGQIQLPEHMTDTLEIIRRYGPIGTVEIFSHLRVQGKATSITVNAINNRLTALWEIGIIERAGNGSRYNSYEWSLKP